MATASPAKKRSQQPRRAALAHVHDAQYSPWFKVAEGVGNMLSATPKYAAWCFVAWEANSAIETASERVALATLFAGMLNQNTITWIAVLVAVLAVCYGVFQKRLREDQIKQDGAHRQRLEARLDPSRSSSNLLPNGNTNPDDVL